jgi:hypothetical protein
MKGILFWSQGHCAHFEAQLESLADSTQIPHRHLTTARAQIQTLYWACSIMQEAHLLFNPSQKLKTNHPFQVQNKPSIWDRLQKSTLEKNRNFLYRNIGSCYFLLGVLFWGLTYANLCAPLLTPIGHKCGTWNFGRLVPWGLSPHGFCVQRLHLSHSKSWQNIQYIITYIVCTMLATYKQPAFSLEIWIQFFFPEQKKSSV